MKHKKVESASKRDFFYFIKVYLSITFIIDPSMVNSCYNIGTCVQSLRSTHCYIL